MKERSGDDKENRREGLDFVNLRHWKVKPKFTYLHRDDSASNDICIHTNTHVQTYIYIHEGVYISTIILVLILI